MDYFDFHYIFAALKENRSQCLKSRMHDENAKCTLCTRDTTNYLTSETDTTRRGAWFKMESGELTIILIYVGEFGSRVVREIKCTYLCLFAINSILNNISLPQKQQFSRRKTIM